MSLRLYLDDCAYDRLLTNLLRAAGHEVVTPPEARLSGRDDPEHFEYARGLGLVLVTKNPADFEALHRANPGHPGVIAIYQDNDPTRDMSHADIVRSIANIEAAGADVAGQFIPLNAWRY